MVQFALCCRPVAAICVCVMLGPLRRPNPCGLLYRLLIGWARFRPATDNRNFSANILALIGAIGRRSAIITYRVRKIISRRVTLEHYCASEPENYNGFILALHREINFLQERSYYEINITVLIV